MSYDIHVCTSPTLLRRFTINIYKYVYVISNYMCRKKTIYNLEMEKYLISHSCKYFCTFRIMKYENVATFCYLLLSRAGMFVNNTVDF